MQRFYSILADVILVLHGLIVLFIVGALPLIWFGAFRKWSFVRAFSFRLSHLLLIGAVAAESIFGVICPLTTWEDQLRLKAGLGARYEGGYIAHWVHRLLFYQGDERIFTITYVVFFALVLLTLLLVQPRMPSHLSGRPRLP
jgi:hypothetical protein